MESVQFQILQTWGRRGSPFDGGAASVLQLYWTAAAMLGQMSQHARQVQ